VNERQKDLAKIHIARKELGLDEDVYRDILWSVGRVDSARELDDKGRAKLLGYFRKTLHWQSRSLPADKQSPGARQAWKIHTLWAELHRSGHVKDPSDRGLFAFCKRMTQVERPEWLTAQQANIIIEALKSWLTRPLNVPAKKP